MQISCIVQSSITCKLREINGSKKKTSEKFCFSSIIQCNFTPFSLWRNTDGTRSLAFSLVDVSLFLPSSSLISCAAHSKISTRIIPHIRHMCLCVCACFYGHALNVIILHIQRSWVHHEELIADNYSSENEFAFAIYFSLRRPNRLWLLKQCVPISSRSRQTPTNSSCLFVCVCVCTWKEWLLRRHNKLLFYSCDQFYWLILRSLRRHFNQRSRDNKI